MSFEVAALHATLGVRTQGFNEGISATNQLTASINRLQEAQQAIEAASQSASAAIQAQGLALEDAVRRYQQVTQATAAAQAQLQASGRSVADVRSSISALTSEIAANENQVSSMEAEMARLQAAMEGAAKSGDRLNATEFSRFFSIQPEIEALTSRIQGLKAELGEQVRIEGLVSGAGAVRAEAQVEKLTGSINKATQAQVPFQRRTRLSQTALASLISSMRTGNLSASGLALGVQGLASSLGVLGIVAGVAVIALAGMVTKMALTADALSKINPQFVEMAHTIDTLGGEKLVQFAGQLETVANRLEAVRSSAPRTTARELAEVASQLQHLNSSRDVGQTLAAVTQALESVSTAPLADFGVADLTQELQQLADQGYGRAAQQARIWAEIQLTISRNSVEIAQKAEQERNSLSGLGTEIRNMFSAAAESEGFKQVITVLVDTVRDLFVAFKPLVPVLKVVGIALVVGLVGPLTLVNLAILGITRVIQGLLHTIAIIPGIGKPFQDASEAVGRYGDEVQGALFGTEDLTKGVDDINESFVDLGRDAPNALAQVQSRFEEFRNSVTGGFSVVGSIRGVATAWQEMERDLTPATALATVQAVDQAMGVLAEHGTDSLLRLQDQFRNMFAAGLIDRAAFESVMGALNNIEEAAIPLVDEVKRIESSFGENQTAAQNAATVNNQVLTPSIQGIGDTAVAVAGQVDVLTGSIASLQAQGSAGVNFGVSGGIAAGGIPTFAQDLAGTPLPGSTSAARDAARRGRSLPGEFTSPEARRIANQRADVNFRDAIGRVAQDFPVPKAGGGGGGSGLASIEDIRELFRQLNGAILAGLRGGVVFSTAGNAIPAGGPAEFLNTKGGTLIQTVNIRGIWDFADPAAKRQIIRELEESLNSLKREK